MRYCVQPGSGTRISRDEDQLAVFRSGLRPFEIVLAPDRLVVLINPEESHIQVVAWICKIIGIAAKKGDLKLRGKHKPHIGVLLVAIKIVLSALIKCDDVAAQPGLFG